MKHVLTSLFLFAVTTPAVAADAPYYGPMKAWHGWGYRYGYKDDFAKDGSWRVDAAARSGHAVDVAMYRTAERAREAGFAYVQFLRARGSDGPAYSYATVFSRPSHSPAAPAECGAGRAGACYTAEVAEVLRRLGGANGRQPGVAIADHYDRYGRAVSYSGFGIGMALAAAARPVAPPAPAPVLRMSAEPAKAERYAALLTAARPMSGHDSRRGWTISD